VSFVKPSFVLALCHGILLDLQVVSMTAVWPRGPALKAVLERTPRSYATKQSEVYCLFHRSDKAGSSDVPQFQSTRSRHGTSYTAISSIVSRALPLGTHIQTAIPWIFNQVRVITFSLAKEAVD
jgi:hypothetical protein